MFVSHPDEDHINGVIELLENGADWGIVVEQLFLPAIAEGKRTESFATLLAAAEVAEVPVSYIKCGDEIRDSQLRLLCLHPRGEYDPCRCQRLFGMLLCGGVCEEDEAGSNRRQESK